MFYRLTTRRTALVLALFALLLGYLASATGTLQAHGELERSRPPANSVLLEPPEEVLIYLTEVADLPASEVKVLNREGLRVDRGATQAPTPGTLAVALAPLAPGTYTVAWQATSVSDGHRTSGSFRFTVSGGGRLFLGTGGDAAAATAAPGSTLVNSLTRWTELAGLSLLVGTLGSLLLVWRPVWRRYPELSSPDPGQAFRSLAGIGLALAAGALLAEWLYRSWAAAGGIGDLAGATLGVAFQGQAGLLLPVRLALVALLAVLWWRNRQPAGQYGRGFLTPVAVLTGLLLLGRSLGGHAAASATGSVGVNIASDFLHLLAACLWVGGLAALLVGLKAADFRQDLVARTLPRFSLLALVALAMIGVTGIYQGWLTLGSYPALWRTPYGKLLLCKTGFLLPVLGLGAWHFFLAHPGALGRWRGRGVRLLQFAVVRLRLSLPGEVAGLAVILLLTAFLSNLPLGKYTLTESFQASQAPLAMPVSLGSGEPQATFGVTPNRAGSNTLLLELTDSLGDPVAQEAFVTARLSSLDRTINLPPVRLPRRGPGQYAATSDALSVAGAWVASVSISRPSRPPRRVDYLFRVAGPAEEPVSVWSGVAGFLTGRKVELPHTGPLVPGDADQAPGRALLQQADASMNRLTALHECNNINGLVTVLDYAAPDRMRYSVRDGGTAVIAGDQQWYRRGDSPWQSQPRANRFRFPNFHYSEGAQNIRREADQTLRGRPHQVVSFYSPQDDADYVFWIDAESHRLSRLVMNAPPSHYMVSVFTDFDRDRPLATPDEPADSATPVATVDQRSLCDSYLP